MSVCGSRRRPSPSQDLDRFLAVWSGDRQFSKESKKKMLLTDLVCVCDGYLALLFRSAFSPWAKAKFGESSASLILNELAIDARATRASCVHSGQPQRLAVNANTI